jgi:hypothetical protein
VGAILDAPERWSILEAGVRRYLMPRFPFVLYYRVRPEMLALRARERNAGDKKEVAQNCRRAVFNLSPLSSHSVATKECAPRDSNPEPID